MNPTVTVDIVDGALSDGDTSSVVTFTFSEAPVGFDASRHHGGRRHGHAAWPLTADPLVYTATFTADDGFAGTGSVSVDGRQLHRRGRQPRRRGLRHRRDRHR